MQVRLVEAGVRELLNSDGVRDELVRRMTRVLDEARATAPVVSGAYRDSLVLVVEHTDRVRVRVQSDLSYSLKVEANHGTLALALDLAGGV